MGKGSERTLQMAGKPTKRYSTRLAIREIQTKTTVRYHCTPIRRRQWHPTPVLLPRKSHGQRSLEGCSPWGCWGSDTTEQLHFHFSLSCIGEGNGNPLQCSCLESPRAGEAWWAAVYGVTQSRTRLKWLSSKHACMPFLGGPPFSLPDHHSNGYSLFISLLFQNNIVLSLKLGSFML